jgi:hypothetical protein
MVFQFIGGLFFIFVTCTLLCSFSTVTAQTLVPGIHGISIVQGVKFTWVIVSSDREISANLRCLGNGSAPPILITATALINVNQSNPITTGASQVLNSGWTSPNSLSIGIEGTASLYDVDLILVVVSPYTGPPITAIVQGQGKCDSSYLPLCIPSPPPYLNCRDIQAKDFKVSKPDPHGFDDDNDGIGCEST